MKKITPKQQCQFIAIHEAAHAFSHLENGDRILQVSISPNYSEVGGKLDGFVKTDCSSIATSSNGATQAAVSQPMSASAVDAVMAGRAGTEALCPEITTNGHGSDWKELATIIRSYDRRTVDMLNWLEKNPEATAEEFYQRYKKPLIRKFKSVRAKRAIKALARELSRCGSLSGQQAVSILNNAYGAPGLPKSLPVEKHGTLTDNGPKNYFDLLRSIDAHLGLMLHDVNCLRDSCEAEENVRLDRVARQLLFLKEIALPPARSG